VAARLVEQSEEEFKQEAQIPTVGELYNFEKVTKQQKKKK